MNVPNAITSAHSSTDWQAVLFHCPMEILTASTEEAFRWIVVVYHILSNHIGCRHHFISSVHVHLPHLRITTIPYSAVQIFIQIRFYGKKFLPVYAG
jgi:hypothetical protein